MTVFRRLIPSMFHRRLILLLGVVFGALGVLWGQLFRLTVAQGTELRAAAERALIERTLLPTERGKIFDRRGRVLAQDRPRFDVQVEYRVITGRWAYDEARSAAYKDNREKWSDMSFEDREALIAQYRPEFDEQLESLWNTLARLGDIERAELEERKAGIVERVQRLRADLWGRWHRERQKELERNVGLDEVAGLIREEQVAHTLLEALPDEPTFELQSLAEAAQWPGLRIERSRMREHPLNSMKVGLDPSTLPTPIRTEETVWIDVDQVATNLIGSMRDAWAEDVRRRPFDHAGGDVDLGGYRDGDQVGSDGIEAAEEDLLRGLRGQLLIHRDSQAVERQSPVPGRDVHLSIDVALEARITAIMDPRFGLTRVQPWHQNQDTPQGTELYGSALVMDVDSGELLALVSTPVARADATAEQIRLDPNNPSAVKPLQAQYPPGSTIKPIMYAIAAANRAIEWDQTITCNGALFPEQPRHFRCWGWRPEEGYELKHGSLGPTEAIARSCNIYFYTCGRRLGARRLIEQVHLWGLGESTGLRLPGEAAGTMPSLVSPNRVGMELSDSNATMMGIGQGPIAVSPLQIAAAHAALARGGYYRAPLLVREHSDQRVERDLSLPPRVVQNALKGMYEAANSMEIGTACYIKIDGAKERIFNFPGVMIRAKTGTAQATKQFALVHRVNQAGQDEIVADTSKVLRQGDHSWYVAHVAKPGQDRAFYIVAVMIEYGGSGGKVSGPIANQILYALRDEGYL